MSMEFSVKFFQQIVLDACQFCYDDTGRNVLLWTSERLARKNFMLLQVKICFVFLLTKKDIKNLSFATTTKKSARNASIYYKKNFKQRKEVIIHYFLSLSPSSSQLTSKSEKSIHKK